MSDIRLRKIVIVDGLQELVNGTTNIMCELQVKSCLPFFWVIMEASIIVGII